MLEQLSLFYLETLKQRVDQRTQFGDPNECWPIVKGAFFKNGYGRVRVNVNGYHTHKPASKIVWWYYNGRTNGLQVQHLCHNPPCVNPNHLKLGTPKQNTTDMYNAGRAVDPKGEEHGRSKLTENEVLDIKNWLKLGIKQQQIADLYGVNQVTVSLIKRGVIWSHL